MNLQTRPDADPEARAPRRASGSSFYMAMRILPRAQRDGMFEIYSFCRQVDDIADSDAPRRAAARAARALARRHRRALCRPHPGRRSRGLPARCANFSLRKEDFLAVIDGMEMDAVEDIRAPDLATLDLYCDRVASAVGRLSVRVFGLDRDAGLRLAHHLGRALQLTNILRDLDEDAGVGRLYLPREGLREAGIAATDPATVVADPALPRACTGVIARARNHFAEAEKIMAAAPRRAVRAPRIMGEVYRAILDGLVARGFAPPRAARAGEPRPAASPSCCATRSSDGGHVHIIGAGLAGLAAAVRLVGAGRRVTVHEATAYPGGRCRSYYDHATDMAIDNGNHLVLSGNRAALAYARAIGSEAGLVGPDKAEFPLRRSRHPRALDAAHQRRPHPVVDLRPAGAGAGHRRRRLSARWRGCCGAAATGRSARSSTVAGRSTTGWCVRCCSRRSTSSRRRAPRRWRGRSCARRWRAAAPPAGR